jgi:hypothetical protein
MTLSRRSIPAWYPTKQSPQTLALDIPVSFNTWHPSFCRSGYASSDSAAYNAGHGLINIDV